MANNKTNKLYTVKDCTPFSQDVNDDVLKKLSEYFEKTAEGSNDDGRTLRQFLKDKAAKPLKERLGAS